VKCSRGWRRGILTSRLKAIELSGIDSEAVGGGERVEGWAWCGLQSGEFKMFDGCGSAEMLEDPKWTKGRKDGWLGGAWLQEVRNEIRNRFRNTRLLRKKYKHPYVD
jgi:hypothetical protein